MSINTYRCPGCGATVDFDNATDSVLICPSCGNILSSDGATLVINEKVKATVSGSEKFFAKFAWFLLIIPGAVMYAQRKSAATYFGELSQKIQHDASQIDNYLEQRVVILENLSALITKEMDFEKDVVGKLSAYHGGINADSLSNAASDIDQAQSAIQEYINNNKELRSTAAVEKAIKDNDYLQREITAARELYNDSIKQWNDAIFGTTAQRMVAVQKRYTTKVPFTTTRTIREKARSVLF